MGKGSLIVRLSLIAGAIILFGAPFWLIMENDKVRMAQLNKLQANIIETENKTERELIKSQVAQKISDITAILMELSEQRILERFGAPANDPVIRNSSYSKPATKQKITGQFLALAGKMNAEAALVLINGNSMAVNRKGLEKTKHAGKDSFTACINSKKAVIIRNLKEGLGEYYIPVIDAKDQLVSIIYIKENITEIADKIRTQLQSPHGYNFIADPSGLVILSSDRSKENNENLNDNNDLKPLMTRDVPDTNVKEATYNKLLGLLGYVKLRELMMMPCVFTPYSDYKSLSGGKEKKYEPFISTAVYGVPVIFILAGAFILGIIFLLSASGSNVQPLKKIISAVARIDDDSFEAILPPAEGDMKKLTDALVILKGRLKAAEDKTEKLSQMGKELEEELSKEASRADHEISELRNAVKNAENAKASAQEQITKAKNEAEKAAKEADEKIKAANQDAERRVNEIQKKITALEGEIKKAQESKIPVEKENMRMEAVLMMNTELKGVLSVIKTYISSVLGGEGKITDAQQQFLGVVINKSARLERLINDLTELARLEKGDIAINKQPVDLNTIVSDILLSIQPQADVKKVEIKQNFAPSLASGLGDSSRISNVLSQLITQAIKVSPRGGQVTIKTSDDDKAVYLRISDFGMSLPKVKTELLFLNFHGTESAAGPEFSNTGLRFPIIKAVIRNMNGDIWVESEIGKGKTFVIMLPKEGKGGASLKAPEIKAVQKEPELMIEPVSMKETIPPAINTEVPAAPKTAEQPPAPSAGFKIARNTFDSPAAAPSGSAPSADKPKIMSNFASMGIDTAPSEKKPEPMKSVKIQSNNLMADLPLSVDLPEVPKVKDVISGPPPSGNAPETKIPGAGTKVPEKLMDIKLPDELPPLPDLQDDKGSDLI